VIDGLVSLVEPVSGPSVTLCLVMDQVDERNFGVVTDRVRSELAVLAERHPEIVVLCGPRALGYTSSGK